MKDTSRAPRVRLYLRIINIVLIYIVCNLGSKVSYGVPNARCRQKNERKSHVAWYLTAFRLSPLRSIQTDSDSYWIYPYLSFLCLYDYVLYRMSIKKRKTTIWSCRVSGSRAVV